MASVGFWRLLVALVGCWLLVASLGFYWLLLTGFQWILKTLPPIPLLHHEICSLSGILPAMKSDL